MVAFGSKADSETPVDQNVLTIRVQPDEGVSLRMEAKVPEQLLQIQSVKMDFRFGGSSPEAYERLLLDDADASHAEAARPGDGRSRSLGRA